MMWQGDFGNNSGRILAPYCDNWQLCFIDYGFRHFEWATYFTSLRFALQPLVTTLERSVPKYVAITSLMNDILRYNLFPEGSRKPLPRPRQLCAPRVVAKCV